MASPRVAVDLEIDGETDQIELPTELIDLFREQEDETDVEIVADTAVMAFAERAHAIVHHEQDAGEELEAIESEAMDVFEERFGMTYGEATGHQH